jgi:hypothetical protein
MPERVRLVSTSGQNSIVLRLALFEFNAYGTPP